MAGIRQFKQFSTITGLSETRRPPRLGKIRLGIKAKTKNGKEYPKDVDYFVCSDEVKKIYGDQPRELEVMLPAENPEGVFPQSLRRYKGNQLLACKGNSKMATAWDGKELTDVACPCPFLTGENDQKISCSPRASLMIILPRVSVAGIYQIDTGSINNIIRLNSDIEYIYSMFGKISWISLKLRREETSIHYEGKKVTKHLLSLRGDGKLETVMKIRAGAGNRQLNAARTTSESPAEPSIPDISHMEDRQQNAHCRQENAHLVSEPLTMEEHVPVTSGYAEVVAPQDEPPAQTDPQSEPPNNVVTQEPAQTGVRRKMHIAQRDFLNDQLRAVVDELDLPRLEAGRYENPGWRREQATERRSHDE